MKDVWENLDWSRLGELLSYDASSPMIFSSGLFFFLFLLFFPIYILLRDRQRMRILYVVLFSLFFYYKSGGIYFLLLLLSATSDYYIAHRLATSSEERRRKLWMILSVVLNLALLSYFKYFNFLGSMMVGLVQELGLVFNYPEWVTTEWTAWDIVLPVGISFYTFQTMSYIIDIYRGEIKPLRRWLDYVFYVSFFPQLVAGPIVRARDFIPQIYKRPYLGREEYTEALLLILSGLFKKAIISDYISLNFVDRIFDAPTLYTGIENLLGVYGYALQIYCDFSGYSDMAIGLALLLGFRFNLNFDSPYQSSSITEFWRRWHISLSSWLRDYLYISLGGNRRGQVRTYFNLILTMLLGGLWHGAAVRFILWGALHGVSLAIHKLWCLLVPSSALPSSELPRWRRWLGRVLTFHLVCLGWILFRADDMEVAGSMLKQIFTQLHPEVLWQFVDGYRGVAFLMLLGYILHFLGSARQEQARQWIESKPIWVHALLFVALLFILVQVRSSEIQPFIYFQF